jgi:hypothetical protein
MRVADLVWQRTETFQRLSAVWQRGRRRHPHDALRTARDHHHAPVHTLPRPRVVPRTVIQRNRGHKDRARTRARSLLTRVAAGDTPCHRRARGHVAARRPYDRVLARGATADGWRGWRCTARAPHGGGDSGRRRAPWSRSRRARGSTAGCTPGPGHSAHASVRPNSQERGGLAAWQPCRVVDYFEENIACGITVSEPADLVGPSQPPFSRTVSTGLPPHQWQPAQADRASKRLRVQRSVSGQDHRRLRLLAGRTISPGPYVRGWAWGPRHGERVKKRRWPGGGLHAAA